MSIVGYAIWAFAAGGLIPLMAILNAGLARSSGGIVQATVVLFAIGLSVRAYNAHGMMVDADIIDGAHVEGLIARLFDNPDAAYIHAHNARRGCYSGRIDRG